MSKLFVDDIVEKTSGHGVNIPGHVSQMIRAALTPRLAGSVTAGTYIDTGDKTLRKNYIARHQVRFLRCPNWV
mgnify:CR=1 FL=1